VTSPLDPHAGHVGGPLPNTEFKLVDVPEMNYTSLDVENGVACPRGEICIRGAGVFLGYYKAQDKTIEAIDRE
jgi:long-chain acyl-CoA synthetase